VKLALLSDYQQLSVMAPDELLDQQRIAAMIQRLLRTALTPREREIVRLRTGCAPEAYGDEHTFEQIACKLDISRQRVNQVWLRALSKIVKAAPTGWFQRRKLYVSAAELERIERRRAAYEAAEVSAKAQAMSAAKFWAEQTPDSLQRWNMDPSWLGALDEENIQQMLGLADLERRYRTHATTAAIKARRPVPDFALPPQPCIDWLLKHVALPTGIAWLDRLAHSRTGSDP
jgi:DNA-binding CsgD family transcriptional regulator